MTVISILEKLHIDYEYVELGEVKLVHPIDERTLTKLRSELNVYKLELIEDKNNLLIERIILAVTEMIQNKEEITTRNSSTHLSAALNMNYKKITNTFSSCKGMTLEHFIILKKTKLVKKMIAQNQTK
jgi:hypothetical protein